VPKCEWCSIPNDNVQEIEVDHPQLGGRKTAKMCKSCVRAWDSVGDPWRAT
jgi:hypothetical protein